MEKVDVGGIFSEQRTATDTEGSTPVTVSEVGHMAPPPALPGQVAPLSNEVEPFAPPEAAPPPLSQPSLKGSTSKLSLIFQPNEQTL